jgi:hypothetical protein
LVSLFLSLSLYHSSNNPCYLSSHVLSVGTGCLCAGRQSLGDSSLSLGDSLMAAHRRETFYGSTCFNFPPCFGCSFLYMGPTFANVCLCWFRCRTYFCRIFLQIWGVAFSLSFHLALLALWPSGPPGSLALLALWPSGPLALWPSWLSSPPGPPGPLALLVL